MSSVAISQVEYQWVVVHKSPLESITYHYYGHDFWQKTLRKYNELQAELVPPPVDEEPHAMSFTY